jgi:hypothetical protein
VDRIEGKDPSRRQITRSGRGKNEDPHDGAVRERIERPDAE